MPRINLHVPVAAALFLAVCGAACAQQNVFWTLPNFSDRLEVRVSNPGSGPVHTLAVIDVARARAMAPGFPGTAGGSIWGVGTSLDNRLVLVPPLRTHRAEFPQWAPQSAFAKRA
jgi:hypothetical protein